MWPVKIQYLNKAPISSMLTRCQCTGFTATQEMVKDQPPHLVAGVFSLFSAD